MFADQESSLWIYDKVTGQYYLHGPPSTNRDLNVANPEMRDEIARTIGFWRQDRGISPDITTPL